MAVDKLKKYTAEEYFELDLSPDMQYELWHGEIVALASPSGLHQDIVLAVASELRSFIRSNGGDCIPRISPFDVVLADDIVVEPDFMVICDPNKLDKEDKRCYGAPDLTVEVVSGDRGRDYRDKLELYKNSGVREYWIIDPEKEKVLVYRFDDRNPKGLDFYTFDMPVPVGIYNGALKITINDII